MCELVLWVLLVIFVLLIALYAYLFFTRGHFHCDRDLRGRVAIVTGANTGNPPFLSLIVLPIQYLNYELNSKGIHTLIKSL